MNNMDIKNDNNTAITPELLTRFVLGETTEMEWFAVTAAMRKYPAVRQMVLQSMGQKEGRTSKRPIPNPHGLAYRTFITNISVLPVARLAATSEANDCVVRCEQYVLSERGRKKEYDALLEEARKHDWLQREGMPLYNIGRLLELAAFSVARMFNGSMKAVKSELSAGCSVIVALNAEALTSAKAAKGAVANHAGVVLDVNVDEKTVEVYDPQRKPSRLLLPERNFLRAWKASRRYFVSIVERGVRPYIPHPEYVGHIKLPEDILPAADLLAEKAHDNWAAKRQAEAEEKRRMGIDTDFQKGPFMKPFMELTKAKRKADYLTALNTIKLIFKLGFTITRQDNTPVTYTPNRRTDDGQYIPQPANVDDVTLPKELEELTEYIAENNHEEWSKLRIKEGWTFAPETNKTLKQSQDLLPYCELLDSEKQYDRDMAMDTLKLLCKLGFRIEASKNH